MSLASFLRSRGVLQNSAQQLIQMSGVRFYKHRGRRPEEARNLAMRLEELNYKDPDLHLNINIGFRVEPPSRKELLPQRLKFHSAVKQNKQLELAAKERSLEIPLDEVNAEWEKSLAPMHLRSSAEYFNIYSDLFGDASFTPIVPLKITYGLEIDQETKVPVCRGNIIKPTEAKNQPEVIYSANENELYTLAMTTPDCHFTEENGEYVHWLIGNIPGNKVGKGDELVNYLQPFPPRGAGFCRYIFILYKQDSKIDLSKYRRELPCTNLSARSFSTLNFYRDLQDVITPCGLAFFQADWDTNLTAFYHDILDMKEPIFEYEFESGFVLPKPLWFPHKKPFNLYLDKYKDPKELQKELLIEKLKERHPFKPPPRKPKYPLAFKLPQNMPSWKNDETRKKRVGEGKFKYM